MHCILCDGEMVLMNVVQVDTMLVAGFEHRTFMCSSCQDVERRHVFVGVTQTTVLTAPPFITDELSERVPAPPTATKPVSAVPDDAAGLVEAERPADVAGQKEHPFAVADEPAGVVPDAIPDVGRNATAQTENAGAPRMLGRLLARLRSR